jgi:hypothetical protein
MRSSSCLVIPEVPSAMKKELAHELVNAKLIIFNDVGGAIGSSLEACASLIRVKVDVQGNVGGLQCHASGLHPQK